MTDINDIQQDLQSIEEIINGPSGLVQTKAAIKRALEAKLNVSIPDENPLKIYDDYVYMIPSSDQEIRKYLVLDDVTYKIDFKNGEENSIIFNPNGEASYPLPNNEILPDSSDKNYGAIANIIITKPDNLVGENIKTGVTIFGVTGTGEYHGSDVSSVTATSYDVSEKVKFVDSSGDPIKGNVQDIRTGEPFNWNTTNINLTENNSFVFNLPTVAELDSNPDNLRVKENVIIDGNFGLETNFSDLVNAINESNNELDTNKILPENIKTGCTLLGVSGTFTSDANATTNNIIYGKTAYVNGEKVTGRIPKRTLNDVTIVVSRGIPEVILKAGSYWYDSDGEGTRYVKNINLPTYNFSFISSSLAGPTPEKDNYLSGPNTITLTPELNVTRDGYLLTGQDTGTSTDVTAGMVINQDYFSDEFLDENGYIKILPSRMLSGTIGVDQFGNILRGNIPIFTSATHGNIEWGYTSYNNNGLITSPNNGSQWGYYNNSSSVLITNEKIKRAYNKSAATDTNRLLPENIKIGSTILGVEGTYTGAQDVTCNISAGIIDFSTKNYQTFTPPAGKVYNSVVINKANTLTSNNIKSGVTIYGVTGDFTKEETNPATNWDLIQGKVAYVNGSKITGTIKYNKPPTVGNPNPNYPGRIYTKTQAYDLDGYYPYGYVGIAESEQEKIISSNIRSGVTILGVAGTFTGGETFTTQFTDSSNPDSPYSFPPFITVDQYGTGFVLYQSGGVVPGSNSIYRFCWQATETSTPLGVPGDIKKVYSINSNANVRFNIIPVLSSDGNAGNPTDIGDAAGSLVRIISVDENDQETDITLDYVTNTSNVKYNFLCKVPGEGYYVKTYTEAAEYDENCGAILPYVNNINQLINDWSYGSFVYNQKFNNDAEVIFDYNKETIGIGSSVSPINYNYKIFTIKIKTKEITLVDVSNTTATQADVLESASFYTADGNLVDGTISSLGDLSRTVTSLALPIEISAGYTTGGTISFSSADVQNITSGNIKKNVTIFGVTGSDTVVDVSGTTAEAGHVLEGNYFYNDEGELTEGTLVETLISQDPETGIVTIV